MSGRILFAGAAALGVMLGVHTVSAQDAAAPVQATLEAKPPIIPTQAFADNNQLSGARLSPAGDKMVVRVNIKGEPNIVIFDTNTMKPVNKFGAGGKIELNWFRWAGNDRILISAGQQGKFRGEDVKYTRLYLADLVTNDLRFVGRNNRSETVVDGDDVIHIADDGSYILVSLQRSIYDYPSVFKFDLDVDGKVREIQTSRDGVWDWYADNDGVVRIGAGWYRNRLRIYYRSSDDDDLDMVGKFREGDKASRYWTVSYVRAGSDLGYVLEETENGRVALRSFDFAKRTSIETIYENDTWDVENAFIGDDGLPEYAEFTDDRDQIVWFDDDDKKLQARLEKALKEEVVRITSRSKDGKRMLVWAGGANDPGALYFYVPDEKRLSQFAEMRASVNFRHLATPMPVQYSARDGVKIRAYLTLPRGREAKNLPLIIMPHGGPYGVRDKLRYDDDVQLLANRGYAVLQPNFRGSGGYGDGFSKLGRGQIGRKMQDDLDDAMDWAVAEGIADAKRVCMVGGSYGGYASLWAVIRNPERYRCAASWAGVTHFKSQLRYDRNYFTRNAGKRWRNRVRGDEDFDLDDVSPAEQAERLTRPVLLAHGTEDSTVPFSQFKKMRKASKDSPVKPQLLIIEDEGHSFSKPENLKLWYDQLVAFLDEHNPAE